MLASYPLFAILIAVLSKLNSKVVMTLCGYCSATEIEFLVDPVVSPPGSSPYDAIVEKFLEKIRTLTGGLKSDEVFDTRPDEDWEPNTQTFLEIIGRVMDRAKEYGLVVKHYRSDDEILRFAKLEPQT